MMRWIVGSSLYLRFLVVAVAVAMMFIGITQLGNMPVDVFPEFAPPLVEIQTEAPGMSASEVESLVTIQLEDALSSTPNSTTCAPSRFLGCRRSPSSSNLGPISCKHGSWCKSAWPWRHVLCHPGQDCP